MSFKCRYCGEAVPRRHVFDFGSHYCNEDCAEAQWREHDADIYAYHMSDGLFSNFEDYMRDKGATIAGDYDMPQRES